MSHTRHISATQILVERGGTTKRVVHTRHLGYIPPNNIVIEISLIKKQVGHISHSAGVPLFNATILDGALCGIFTPQPHGSRDGVICELDEPIFAGALLLLIIVTHQHYQNFPQFHIYIMG